MPTRNRPKKPTKHIRTTWTEEFLRIMQRTSDVWFTWGDVLAALQTLPPEAVGLLRSTVWMFQGLGVGGTFAELHGELVDDRGQTIRPRPDLVVRPMNYHELPAGLRQRTHQLLADYEHVSEWGQLSSPDGFETSGEIIPRAEHYRDMLDITDGDDWLFCVVLAGGHLMRNGNMGLWPVPFGPVTKTASTGYTVGEALTLEADYTDKVSEDQLLAADSSLLAATSEIYELIWIEGVLPGQVLRYIAGQLGVSKLQRSAWR